jgi:hypothetical protein
MWRAVQFNLKPSLADNARATTHPIRYTDNAVLLFCVALDFIQRNGAVLKPLGIRHSPAVPRKRDYVRYLGCRGQRNVVL